ncbi:MAG: ABC transporter permease [Bryobacteraceae bacterium]
MVRGGANGVALGATEHPRLIGIVRTAPNLLDILQATLLLGRNFRPDDALKGHDNVAIITDSLWQSLFRGDPNVIGKTVRLAGIPREIVGVLPPKLSFSQTECAERLPFPTEDRWRGPGSRNASACVPRYCSSPASLRKTYYTCWEATKGPTLPM